MPALHVHGHDEGIGTFACGSYPSLISASQHTTKVQIVAQAIRLASMMTVIISLNPLNLGLFNLWRVLKDLNDWIGAVVDLFATAGYVA